MIKILKEPSLSSYHQMVIQAVMFIFRTLGLKCVKLLPQVMVNSEPKPQPKLNRNAGAHVIVNSEPKPPKKNQTKPQRWGSGASRCCCGSCAAKQEHCWSRCLIQEQNKLFRSTMTHSGAEWLILHSAPASRRTYTCCCCCCCSVCLCVSVCVCVCLCVCVYVCMYVCIYIYIYRYLQACGAGVSLDDSSVMHST